MLDNLTKYNVVLASKSPRRCELLRGMGVSFAVFAKDVVEALPKDISVEDAAVYLSRLKSGAFSDEELPERYLLISADTIVVDGDVILGKPAGREDACRMLRRLSGKPHKVITGVTVRSAERSESFAAVSQVWFEELDDSMIDYYVDNFRPFDKAGSYGIQEWIGYVAISRIEGSFYNVMGLPTQKLYKTLCGF